MDLTNDERDVMLAGLFDLTITYVEDDEKREQCKALADKLGGDSGAMFFGAGSRTQRAVVLHSVDPLRPAPPSLQTPDASS